MPQLFMTIRLIVYFPCLFLCVSVRAPAAFYFAMGMNALAPPTHQLHHRHNRLCGIIRHFQSKRSYLFQFAFFITKRRVHGSTSVNPKQNHIERREKTLHLKFKLETKRKNTHKKGKQRT